MVDMEWAALWKGPRSIWQKHASRLLYICTLSTDSCLNREFTYTALSALQAVGRLENMVGWYHSHPGYGCWLSGIDVSTQSIQQQYQEPFLAIVVDPHRTIAAGKVEIGAFRTYPEVC